MIFNNIASELAYFLPFLLNIAKVVRTPVFLICLVCLSSSTLAQRLNIGFRLLPQLNGMLNSEDSGSEDVTRVLTPGLSAGLAIGYQLNKKFGFEVNVLYGLQGQEYQLRNRGTRFAPDTVGSGAFEKFRRNLTMVKVPIMFVYTLPHETGPSFRIYAGPQLSLLLGATERYRDIKDIDLTYNGISYSGTGLQPSDIFRGIEWSVVAGFRVDFPITQKLSLNTGVRGEYGLTDIENKAAAWRNPYLTATEPTSYYGNYYGANKARTAATNQFAVAFTIGVTFTIDFNRDPNDYYW